MPNRQQLLIENICILPSSSCSAGHNTSIAHLLSNNEISLIVGDINAHRSRWDTNTNEDERGDQLADEIDAIRMEVASSRPDYLPTLSTAETSNLSLLVKHHILAIDEASKQHQQ